MGNSWAFSFLRKYIRRSGRVLVMAAFLIITFVCSMYLMKPSFADRALYDNFSDVPYLLSWYQISPNGKWFSWGSGSEATPGIQGAAMTSSGGVYFQNNPPSIDPQETHSSLVLSTRSIKDFELNLQVNTIAQTRMFTAPNDWENAWILWHCTGNGTDNFDNKHFYYFLMKTGGVEYGKYDGGSQQILQYVPYSSLPGVSFADNTWYNWDVTVQQDHMVIKVNGVTVIDSHDTASFDSGRIGLYSEDSQVQFSQVYLTSLS